MLQLLSMTSPRTVLPLAVVPITMPFPLFVTIAPLISICGTALSAKPGPLVFGVAPGCV